MGTGVPVGGATGSGGGGEFGGGASASQLPKGIAYGSKLTDFCAGSCRREMAPAPTTSTPPAPREAWAAAVAAPMREFRPRFRFLVHRGTINGGRRRRQPKLRPSESSAHVRQLERCAPAAEGIGSFDLPRGTDDHDRRHGNRNPWRKRRRRRRHLGHRYDVTGEPRHGCLQARIAAPGGSRSARKWRRGRHVGGRNDADERNAANRHTIHILGPEVAESAGSGSARGRHRQTPIRRASARVLPSIRLC